MKTIETITDELVDDAVDTCMQDSGYLRSILQCYFEAMSDEERRKAHSEAFGEGELE